MPELCTIYDYMRTHAALLGERILQQYPALHQFDDPVSTRIATLLRKWAGKYRTSGKNIGVPHHEIRAANADCDYQP
jgi:hypothetical protein